MFYQWYYPSSGLAAVPPSVGEYYLNIRKLYGEKIYDFDPFAVRFAASSIKSYRAKGANAIYRKDMKMIENMPLPDHCQVKSISYPVSCGIQFSRMLAIQIQEQMEERIGLTDIHRIPYTSVSFDPFVFERKYCSDDMLILTEKEDEKCFLYFMLQITATPEDPPSSDYPPCPITYFWLRCYDEDHPENAVDPMDETITHLRFEICNEPPRSLPPFEELSKDYPKKALFNLRFTWYVNHPQPDIFWIYDKTRRWEPILKDYLTERITFVEKRIRREARKAAKLASPQPASAQPVMVILPKEGITTYPDVTFIVDFIKDVDEDTVDDLKDFIGDLSERIAKKQDGEGFDFFDVCKTAKTACEITVDFGECPLSAMKSVIRVLKTQVDGVKCITVDG